MGIVIPTFAGDGAPSIQFTITREDGSIVDLTGALAVRFIIQDPRTGRPTNNADNLCVITEANAGVVAYTWAITGTDCPDPGVYNANIRIEYSTTAAETYRLKIVADAPIPNATIA